LLVIDFGRRSWFGSILSRDLLLESCGTTQNILIILIIENSGEREV
jgi:hypothetical protein